MSSLVLTGDTSGQVTLAAPAVAGSNTLTLLAATATSSVNTLGTPTASSGTALTYSSLPSWVKRITISIASLQTSGATTPVFQLSSSATFKTSGYLGAAVATGAASMSTVNWTSGFGISNASWGSTVVIHGSITFTLLNSSTNLWAASGVLGRSDGTNMAYTAGSVTLSGTLDGVRLYIDGTQTFTAGSINILYEG